jgi:HK97 family phage prohead protease
MDGITADRFEALRRRLHGSANRIAWRPEDVTVIMSRFGVTARDAHSVVGPTAYRPLAAVAYKAEVAADDRRTFTFTISSSSVDRMGDTLAVDGWKLGAYQKNPVVLWAHAGELLPVGRATKVWTAGNKLKATAELAPEDMNPDAARVAKMLAGGYLTATSVGFMPLKYAFTDDPQRRFGIDFLEQELLEWSIVSVPANGEALLDPGQTTGKSAAALRRQRELAAIRRSAGL